VRVTDSGSRTATQALAITINPALSVTTTSLPIGVVGSAYAPILVASGGTLPYTWSVATGTLPSGLSLTGSSGLISGTPSAVGVTNFTVRVTDSGSRTATQALSITINPALSLSTTSLPSGITGQAYSTTAIATGGTTPYSWDVSVGTLPDGLSLNASSGAIGGTPTGSGTSSFTLRVTDSGSRTDQRNLSITIIPALSITTTTLPGGVVGSAYTTTTLAATGGTLPYAWSLQSGTLPGGLSLSSAGVISGTPSGAGAATFTVRVTDSGSPPTSQTTTQDLSITINASLAVTTATLPSGVVGTPYTSTTLTAVGGTAPFTWAVTVGTLPPGLSLSTAGVISGTPTNSGTSNFTVRVTDSGSRTATQVLSIAINGSLTITTTSLPSGVLGSPYSFTLVASGGTTPYTWMIATGSLPPGVGLSTAGVISGTPTNAGPSNFTVSVTDNGSRTATQSLTLTINVPLSIITPSPLPTGTVGAPYSLTLTASGGLAPYTWSAIAAALPPGLALSPTGVLGGSPTIAGSFVFTADVRDNSSNTASKSFSMSVVATSFGSLALAITVPTAVNPTQQPEITLTVSAAPLQPIPGSLTLQFISSGVGATDDPAVQFSVGPTTSRKVDFTIPATSTTVAFPSKVLLLTGTIAGTVVMTADIQGGPPGLLVGSITVNTTIPQVTNITAARVSPGLRVLITGYSPERQMISADFGFDVRTPSGTQRVPLSRTVSADFDVWYRNGASIPFGSSFFYEQLFAVQGDSNTIEAVTISLTNAEGKATSASVPITN